MMCTKLVVLIIIITAASAAVVVKKIPCEKENGSVDLKCKKKWSDKFFKILSTNQTWLENSLTEACLVPSNGRLREVIETGRYKLTTQLNGYNEDDFKIKIKSRILYLSARNNHTFTADLVALPRFVDVKKASYYYEDDKLDIVFPINTATGCDRGFRNAVIYVPKFELVWGAVAIQRRERLKASRISGAYRRLQGTGTTTRRMPLARFVAENRAYAAIRETSVFTCERGHGPGIDFNCMKRWHDNLFKVLSRNQTWLEDKLRAACLKRTNGRLREVVETGRYKLTTQLSGYSEDDFDVKIKSNVLYFSANNSYAFNSDFAILPQSIDTEKASYFYEDGTLNIVFPINTAMGTCSRSFESVVRSVPKFEVIWGADVTQPKKPSVFNMPISTESPVLSESISTQRTVLNMSTSTARSVFMMNTPKTIPQDNFPCTNGYGKDVNSNCIEEWHDKLFETLSRNQTWVENNLRNICARSNSRLREVIETDRYKLMTQLRGYSEDDFEIKINGNILYVIASNLYYLNFGFVVLPQFIDATKASHFYEYEFLNIVFPINTATGVCDRGFQDVVINVPKFEFVWGADTKRQKEYNANRTFDDPDPFRENKRWLDEFFEILSRNQTWLENNLRDACLKYSNGRLREVIEANRYKLTTHLKGYSVDDFKIKIKGSILYFSSRNTLFYNVQLATLPRFVDSTKAAYFYYQDTLQIIFPMKRETGVCDRSYGDFVINVPKFVYSWGPNATRSGLRMHGKRLGNGTFWNN